jgi:hypothetical protein
MFSAENGGFDWRPRGVGMRRQRKLPEVGEIVLA